MSVQPSQTWGAGWKCEKCGMWIPSEWTHICSQLSPLNSPSLLADNMRLQTELDQARAWAKAWKKAAQHHHYWHPYWCNLALAYARERDSARRVARALYRLYVGYRDRWKYLSDADTPCGCVRCVAFRNARHVLREEAKK